MIALAKHPMVTSYDLPTLWSVDDGAAPLGKDLAEEVIKRIGCEVMQGYGMTETSPVTHIYNPSRSKTNQPGFYWRSHSEYKQ